MKKVLIVLMSIFFLHSVLAIPINSCQTIDQPGTYELTQNLLNVAGTCITIESPDVTIDGQGHLIEGDGFINVNEHGVFMPLVIGNDRIVIKNLNVRKFDTGVRLSESQYSKIINVSADSNMGCGFAFNGDYLQVINVSAQDNDICGISNYAVSYSNFTELRLLRNAVYGLTLKESHDNNISNFYIKDTPEVSMNVLSYNNKFYNGTIINNKYIGFFGFGSAGTVFKNVSFINVTDELYPGFGGYEIYLGQLGTFTLEDSYIGKYNLGGASVLLLVNHTEIGSIKFTQYVGGEGINLSEDVSVKHNSARVNSIQSLLNRPAEITLLNLPVLNDAMILRDGLPCDEFICMPLTALNQPDVSFAVNEWSEYTIGGSMSCTADFDGDGTVGVPDIFAFLSAWFAQDLSADFDGDGNVVNDVQDIFAFLSAWFAGC